MNSQSSKDMSQITTLRLTKKAIAKDKFMTVVYYTVGGFFLALLLAITVYLLFMGFKDFKIEYLAFSRGGIGNQLFNTIYLVFLSLIISVPLGVATGIYLAEYAQENKFTNFIRIAIKTLSSLPSIIVGLFGFIAFVQLTGMKWNLFAGALAVSVLNLPLLATTTEDAMRNLPASYKKGSMALGATQWQTIYKVLLPACLPRIVTGIILAAGRGFGETAVLLYTSGLSTYIRWDNWNLASITCPLNPFRPGETLSLHIWVMLTEGLEQNAEAIANLSSAILIILVFSFSITARLLSAKIDRKMTGGLK